MAFDLSKPGATTNLITGVLIGATSSFKFSMRVHQFLVDYNVKMMDATGDGSIFTKMEHGGQVYATILVTGWVLASQAPQIANLYSLTVNNGQALSFAFGTNWLLTQTAIVERIRISGAKSGVAYSMAITAHLSDAGVSGSGA